MASPLFSWSIKHSCHPPGGGGLWPTWIAQLGSGRRIQNVMLNCCQKVSRSGCVDGRNLRCCSRDGLSLFYCRYWIRIRPEMRSFYMTLNGVYYFCCVDGVLHLRLKYLHLGWASHLRWAHARCCFKSITAERDLNHIIPFGCQQKWDVFICHRPYPFNFSQTWWW